MAVTAKLNTAWQTNLLEDATFQFRALSQDFYNNVLESYTKMNTLATNPIFVGVDPELVTEGVAILTALNNCKLALDAHLAFINWRPS